MFHSVFDQMEVYECTFYIETGNETSVSKVTAPRMALEQNFLSLAEQASGSELPIKITMCRDIPIYDNFDKKWIKRVNSISCANSAYLKKDR